MDIPDFARIAVTFTRGVCTVRIVPTEQGAIFDGPLLDDLSMLVQRLPDLPGLRVVVFAGTGSVFCAGGDPAWLEEMRTASVEQNVAISLRLERVYAGLRLLSVPVIAGINGNALGAGTGLAAVSDVVVAVQHARFGFGDTHLGVIPSVVAPYLVDGVGQRAARYLFVTSDHIDADTARTFGLVARVVETVESLDAEVDRLVELILRGGPSSVALCKRLPEMVAGQLAEPDRAAEANALLVSRIRGEPEAQEGMLAMLQKRRPSWVEA